ncbi:PIR Superfamily Protein [Plasmodium ovale curtisi]|uniref:PIR Superfamily Protein n=1 Tax=Plasmodium ovale curtisi TaxID=864141 RepID=A0A1A8WRI8_PLAOA|nr:PIR Superfamily Protein [Plasmodium ovale curtisi]
MDHSEEILKGLPKYQIYDELNETQGRNNCYSHCKRLYRFNAQYEGIHDLCCLFEKNLKNLSARIKNENNNTEQCRYFYFWLNDEIRKKLKTRHPNTTNDTNVLLAFYSVGSNINSELSNNNCKYIYDNNVTLDLWKKWKDLYDYIRNYSYIYNKINSNNLCQIYDKYFAYILSLYGEYKKECCGSSLLKCPNNLNMQEWCKADNIFNKLSCKDTRPITTPFSSHGTPEAAEYQHEDDGTHSALFLAREYKHDTNGDRKTNDIDYYVKLGTSLSFLGILSTFFYLYNFTTFGNWIRSKILKNKINVKLDEDTQKLMPHELNNVDENFYSDAYKIKYVPS